MGPIMHLLLLFSFGQLSFASLPNNKHEFRSNPYDILGVSSAATQQEIQRQYRSLCLQHHPDKKAKKESLDNPLLSTSPLEKMAAFHSSSQMVEVEDMVQGEKVIHTTTVIIFPILAELSTSNEVDHIMCKRSQFHSRYSMLVKRMYK